MKNYLVIGKATHACSIYLKNKEGGFDQVKMVRGKKLQITEHQMSFHVEKQVGAKLIEVVELEETEDPVVVEETPAPAPVEAAPAEAAVDVVVKEFASEDDNKVAQPPVRRRRKKKKTE